MSAPRVCNMCWIADILTGRLVWRTWRSVGCGLAAGSCAVATTSTISCLHETLEPMLGCPGLLLLLLLLMWTRIADCDTFHRALRRRTTTCPHYRHRRHSLYLHPSLDTTAGRSLQLSCKQPLRSVHITNRHKQHARACHNSQVSVSRAYQKYEKSYTLCPEKSNPLDIVQ